MTDALTHPATRERATKRRHRAPNGMGVYVTDLELYKYLGVPPDTASQAIAALDHDPRSLFPKKQALWGNRRYLPAVEAWLNKTNGLILQAQPAVTIRDRKTV